MGWFGTLLKSLPEIVALIKILQKAAKEAEEERKVKDDLKKIHEAFEKKDPEALRTLFNS